MCMHQMSELQNICETNIIERRNKPTIILGNFNIYFSANGRTTRQKIRRDIEELNNTINQKDLMDIHRTLLLTTTQ